MASPKDCALCHTPTAPEKLFEIATKTGPQHVCVTCVAASEAMVARALGTMRRRLDRLQRRAAQVHAKRRGR